MGEGLTAPVESGGTGMVAESLSGKPTGPGLGGTLQALKTKAMVLLDGGLTSFLAGRPFVILNMSIHWSGPREVTLCGPWPGAAQEHQSEKDAKLSQKLGQLQPFIAILPHTM